MGVVRVRWGDCIRVMLGASIAMGIITMDIIRSIEVIRGGIRGVEVVAGVLRTAIR